MKNSNNYPLVYLREETCYDQDELVAITDLNDKHMNVCKINNPLSSQSTQMQDESNFICSLTLPSLLILARVIRVYYLSRRLFDINENYEDYIAKISLAVLNLSILPIFIYGSFSGCAIKNCDTKANNKNAIKDLATPYEIVSDICYKHYHNENKVFHELEKLSYDVNKIQSWELDLSSKACDEVFENILQKKCQDHYTMQQILAKHPDVPEFCYNQDYFRKQYAHPDLTWNFIEEDKSSALHGGQEQSSSTNSYYAQFLQYLGFMKQDPPASET